MARLDGVEGAGLQSAAQGLADQLGAGWALEQAKAQLVAELG